mgnify:CR=1 FL=1
MSRIYTLYTGCTPRIAEPELLKSTLAVAEYLGIELLQKREYSCCGGSHIQDIDDFSSLLLNGRNLAYADNEGLDLITICNTCQLMLSDARERLLQDPELRQRVNRRLEKYHLQFTGKSRVRHFLYLLIDEFGYDGLAAKTVRPLTGLKVASFYGCHNIRPASLQENVNRKESPWQPRSLDNLVKALGGEPVYYESSASCCGFHISLHAQESADRMTGKVLRQAYEAGADCIITPCPLCHTNLDSMQPEALTRVTKGPELPLFSAWPNAFHVKLPVVDEPVSLPALHFEQLLGIAFGISARKLGLRHHVVPVKRSTKLMEYITK